MARVYKRSKEGRSSGQWWLDFTDQHGVRRRIPTPDGTKKADAEKELRRILELVARNSYVHISDMPGFAELAHSWLASKKHGVRDTTWNQYRQHVDLHLIPFFGETRADRIRFAQVDAFMAAKLEEGTISRATLRKILTTLSTIMVYASRRGLTDFYPKRDIPTVPKEPDKRQEDHEITPLTHDQINVLLDGAPTPKTCMMLFIAIFTGIRQGELLGLQWSDVDFEDKQLHIRRTFNHGKFRDTKSVKSYRNVDLGPQALARLKEWKLQCPPNEYDLVFPSRSGTPINSSNLINRLWEPLLEKLELPKTRWHDLRHTYASLQIEQGVSIKYLQSQLGHASITLTMDTYGHLMRRFNHEAASALERAVLSTNGTNLAPKRKKGHD